MSFKILSEYNEAMQSTSRHDLMVPRCRLAKICSAFIVCGPQVYNLEPERVRNAMVDGSLKLVAQIRFRLLSGYQVRWMDE